MDDQQTIRVDVPGKGVVEFPAGTSPEQIESALAQFKQSSEPKFGESTLKPDAPKPSDRHWLTDLGIGAAKGTGQTAVDLGKMFLNVFNPGVGDRLTGGLGGRDVPALQTEGTAQRIGSFAPDVAAVALPALRGARAPQAVEQAAARMWQNAAKRPVLEPTTQANQILKEGFGRLTRQNAMGYSAAHPTSTTARQVMVKGVENARDNPQTLSGLLTGSFSPGTRAMTAQGIHSAAPAINAATHGLGGGVADILFRLLSGGR